MAGRKTKGKDYPLSMRMPRDDIAIIDRAATMRGRTRTDFMRDAAVRAAEEVILETTLVLVSPAAFKEITQSLERPPSLIPDIVRMMQRKAPWEK